MYKQISLVRPNLGNPLILQPQELKRFEITVAYYKNGDARDEDVPYLSVDAVKEILQQDPPRIEWGNITIPLSIFNVHDYFRHPPYHDNYGDVEHAQTSAQQQYRNNFRWEMRIDVGINEQEIDNLQSMVPWPSLLDVCWPGHVHSTNSSALYIHETLKQANEFTILHITDTHIAKRNDQIPKLLCQVRNKQECNELKSRYVNFNDNLRAFIKQANERARNGEDVVVILTGDIVDYYFDGYWNGKFICGQDGQNAPDRREELPISSRKSNVEKFREIILGEDNLGDKLLCPIFTVLGNHDYYMNEILLDLVVNVLGLRRVHPHNNFSAFGLDKDEGREYDFWAFPRADGTDHILAMPPGLPIKIKDSIAIRKTFKEIIRNSHVPQSLENKILKEWEAVLTTNWGYWLLKPKSWQLSEYLNTINYDTDFSTQIGNHSILCLNTAYDSMPRKEEFLSSSGSPLNLESLEDTDKDYVHGGPHSRGITDEHIRLIQQSLNRASNNTVFIFTHAPIVGMPRDAENRTFLYEDRHSEAGQPPNQVSNWLAYALPAPRFPENEAEPELGRTAKTIRWLKNQGFPLRKTKYFKSGNRDPHLNFSCSDGKTTKLLKLISRKNGQQTNKPVVIFSGHTHKVHEFRTEKDQRSKLYYFVDNYSERYFSHTTNALMLGLRMEWLKQYSPLLLTSGAIKNKNPQFREVVVKGQSIASLEMKQLEDINQTSKFTPGCQKVALRAHNGQYVCAEDGGNQDLVANRNTHREWETFEIVELEDNHIALKACNGKFVRAKGGGGGKLIADRYWIKNHETFLLVNRGSNMIALRTYNGKYVCAENGGGKDLIANRDQIKEWETFELVILD